MTDPRITPTNDAPVTVEQCDRDRIKAVSVRLVDRLRDVARQDGWALAVHGSMSRDLDLVAVPWTDDASDEPSFVEAMRAAVACVLGGVAIVGAGEDGRTPAVKIKPNGRRCYTLHSTSAQLVESKAGAHPYIDLSVMDFRLAALASAPAVPREAVEAQLAAVEAKAADTLWTGSPLLKGLAVYVRAIIASAPADEAFTGVEAWDELVNVDDRTSPAEYPDMCLITRDELIDFMQRASAPAGDGVAEVRDEGPIPEARSSLIARAVRQSLRKYGHRVAESSLPECIASDVEATLRTMRDDHPALARPRAAVGEREAERIMRNALQDIGGAEPIPNDAVAFVWCRTVANDALTAILALQSPAAKVER